MQLCRPPDLHDHLPHLARRHGLLWATWLARLPPRYLQASAARPAKAAFASPAAFTSAASWAGPAVGDRSRRTARHTQNGAHGGCRAA